MSSKLPVLPLFILLSSGCAHTLIAGTDVKDTADNREIYAVVQKANEGLAARNSSTVLSVVSPRYFEDNGTAQQDDDYGYEELKDKYLPESMKLTKEMYVDYTVHDIVVDGEHAHVDLRYHSRARVDLPAGSEWDSHRDFNRIELERENGAWRITSGL